MAVNKRDVIFLAIVVAVFGTFFAISGEGTTVRVPYDDIHAQYYPVIKQQGKKAAEVFCKECHNEEKMPFSENHPPPIRCLFCHKTSEQP